tara:strand:+ start:98 stop:226 length:129 start_codon:yes stop_codon:yes gene_type:complete
MIRELKDWLKIIATLAVGLTFIGLVVAWEFGKVIAVWQWILS